MSDYLREYLSAIKRRAWIILGAGIAGIWSDATGVLHVGWWEWVVVGLLVAQAWAWIDMRTERDGAKHELDRARAGADVEPASRIIFKNPKVFKRKSAAGYQVLAATIGVVNSPHHSKEEARVWYASADISIYELNGSSPIWTYPGHWANAANFESASHPTGHVGLRPNGFPEALDLLTRPVHLTCAYPYNDQPNYAKVISEWTGPELDGSYLFEITILGGNMKPTTQWLAVDVTEFTVLKCDPPNWPTSMPAAPAILAGAVDPVNPDSITHLDEPTKHLVRTSAMPSQGGTAYWASCRWCGETISLRDREYFHIRLKQFREETCKPDRL